MVAHDHPPRADSSQSNLSAPSSSASDVFIKLALEQLLAAREAKRLNQLRDAAKLALQVLDSNPDPDLNAIRQIFTPFQLACQSRQPPLAVIAIDCLGKMFSYNYWARHNVYDPIFEDPSLSANASPVGGAGPDADDSVSTVSTAAASVTSAGVGGFMGFGRRQTTTGPLTGSSTPVSDGRRSNDQEDRAGSLDGVGVDEKPGDGGVIGQVVDAICETFSGGENTDDKIQVQIVKALLAAVSSGDPASASHGGVLLRAIRTTYNIFLLSRSSNTQIIAQATLTQMVQAVFGRMPKDFYPPPTATEKTLDSVTDTNSADIQSQTPPLSVTSDANDSASGVVDGTGQSGPTSPASTIPKNAPTSQESFSSQPSATTAGATLDRTPSWITDLFIKDAYLVFRALCKLSMKPIPAPEGATELKSHAMRSKLLSLHLVHTVLSSHIHIFYAPAQVLFPPSTPAPVMFIHAVKQYLCLSISRNAVSVVPQVFDISMDIFGRALVGLRTVLKKEISVIFTEIVIPILEARNSITFTQRCLLLKSLHRIFSDSALSAEGGGGRLLVEIYLNYDCDLEATARENIWERLINTLGRVVSTHVETSGTSGSGVAKHELGPGVGGPTMPPAITTATLTSFTREQVKELYSATGDYVELKRRGLEVLVRGILGPLVSWCEARVATEAAAAAASRMSGDESAEKDGKLGLVAEGDDSTGSSSGSIGLTKVNSLRRIREDDPTAFETLKHRKQALLEGIKRFNFKPKKGIQFLLDSACIPARTSRDIAVFLLHTEGLNKTMIGEFLGEGDEENIAIMHAFVDEMEFANLNFVSALRTFLQSFRLPGESQKIDRYMLKFAERFVQNNPTSFSSADTAYVLAYSVIMLNTDQHNPQVKKRMTKQDFLKNNRGIDEGKDLAPEFLESIFDEIASNEIVMKDDPMGKTVNASSKTPTVGGAAATGGAAAPKKEATQFAIASETMALKTEAMFNTILKSGGGVGAASGHNRTASGSTASSNLNGSSSSPLSSTTAVQFFSATHPDHVKAMFTLTWMSILTGLSGPLQESDDTETVVIALEGFRYATHIACLFDMELERKAFVSTLSKFTQLSGNLAEVKTKNLEAVRALLEISNKFGDLLGESWRDVVACVSQLDKLQVLGAESGPRPSTDVKSKQISNNKRPGQTPNEEIAAAVSSQSMTLTVDRLFTSSANLSGTAIVDFVRALCAVSWEEISTSVAASSETPRMYCLQRLVEISYYNMKRIRVEWSNIWAVLGEHFNKVGCHPNAQVCFFALDKLRQLAIKFLDLEELPNFKFQKDFLRPFEFVLGNNPDIKIKDMVLSCLQQMIQAKGTKGMKSGWKALFGAFVKAGRETNAFDIVKSISKNNFESVVANLALPDFISCLVEFCKNKKFAKTSLQAVEILRQTIPRIFEMSKTPAGSKILLSSAVASEKTTSEFMHAANHSLPQKPLSAVPTIVQPAAPSPIVPVEQNDDPSFRIWFPILFGLHEVVMTCDLEVRTRGLTYLFDALRAHGPNFSRDSWEVVARGVLFPIFDDLRLSRSEHTKFANREDMSVWLSTTLIQALRMLVDLFGCHFDSLRFCIDQLFELLTVCMTQENETLARIGSTCLHQFIESNITKIDPPIWDRICSTFAHLFRVTTPDALFFDYRVQAPQAPPTVIAPPEKDDLPQQGEYSTAAPDKLRISTDNDVNGDSVTGNDPSSNQSPSNYCVPDITGRPKPQKKDFQGIIAKCVLHLLVIQTLQETLATDPPSANGVSVYKSLSSRQLLVLVDCLERSYRFAAAFNADLELRMALYKMGFMKQLPNLLKQETTSVSTYVQVLIRMYADPSEERVGMRGEVERRLVPLSYDILVHYNTLDPDSKKRNVTAWRPVVVSILNALVDLDDDQFRSHIHTFYGPAVGLLLQDPSSAAPEVRLALHSLLVRVGTVFGICGASEWPGAAVPTAGAEGGNEGSEEVVVDGGDGSSGVVGEAEGAFDNDNSLL